MEDGTVTKEKRSGEGEFMRIDGDDERTDGIDDGKEVQEFEITFNKETDLNGSQKPCSEATGPVPLSNQQLKKRLRRQNLGYVLDLKPDLQMANVAKGVYLGSQDVAHDYDILKAHNITHVINCATGVKNIFLGAIKYLTFDVLDLPWTNLEQHFDKCHEFMWDAVESGGNVLVHCNAGVSRSATIVLSYIMRYNKMTLREALEHVNAIRKVSPNPGFVQQLLRYEMKLQCENDDDKRREEKVEFRKTCWKVRIVVCENSVGAEWCLCLPRLPVDVVILFTGLILLSVSLLALLYETNCAAAVMLVKLGETVAIEFGPTVEEVKSLQMLVKNSKLTAFARKEFGDGIEWDNGTLTIRNVTSSHLTTFLYHLHGHPMAISLMKER
uniref:Uncharacterized protein n=1 Tax=Setaria digitata TaxID=48799 RepID=A0A915PKE6_9BILA